ncbi:MAG TPA: PTS fructose transporter subunit IIA [Polyangia bacterium]|nr:PTS fructose transporter subunit IIA [Polyangia bacterium]
MASSAQNPPAPLVGLVIVTHGGSGECLLSAAQGLVGTIDRAAAVSVMLEDSFDAQVSRIEAACARVDGGAGLVILADVHGSSPFRASLAMLDGTRAVEIVCGVNLPMLIKLATVDRQALRPVEIAEIAKEVGKRSIRLGSELTGKITISREERH